MQGIPMAVSRIFAVAESVYMDLIRRKVLYGLFLITLMFTITIPAMPSLGTGVQEELFLQASLGLVSLSVLVFVVIVGSSYFFGEISRKSIYSTLSRPIRRWEYATGVFFGIEAMLVTLLIIMSFILLFFLRFSYDITYFGIYKAIFTIFLEATLINSFCLFMSILITPVLVVFSTILFYVICHIKGAYLSGIIEDASANAAFKALAYIAYYALPNLEQLNINQTIAYSERVFKVGAIDLALLGLAAIAFTGAFLVLCCALFEKKDI